MTDKARRASYQRALETNARLRVLFNRLGDARHPRGEVMIAYRVARQALRAELNDANTVGALDVLSALRRAVQSSTREILQDAFDTGAQQAIDDLTNYGVALAESDPSETMLVANALRTVLSEMDVQLNGAGTQILARIADDSLLLGDDSRVGLLSPGPVILAATTWITGLAAAAYLKRVSAAQEKTRVVFKRQAIAALDENTTDCCLRVHGQVVGMKEDFRLTGTPRFADRLRNPPFHMHCRTSTALLRETEADDDLTNEMRDAADAELKARETQGKKEINPANAVSRRT